MADRCFSDWKMAYEYVPKGLLSELSERMAVVSFEEASDMVSDADSSFGARLFGLFMRTEMEMA
ncbi:hypothetical protein AB8615_01115 [Litorimonas sp. RW-G-Af-16]|uniref:hypothetical protein n=1 Tax=Litorimonas sp. RW-G-Af-16 TaxID=3241168 RepID=UPI003AAD92EA